ncbi:hypothetical protein NDU88_007796 [Pleurodeles waltl]|uniref:Uncharacterized protein n=1 Tax=Pleurodeles waltl TaxID=8319 RepID=A0AAV7STE7_PLEWA|nr:hypothetical protein NDU88_007796 [Pleurodeles waltl]
MRSAEDATDRCPHAHCASFRPALERVLRVLPRTPPRQHARYDLYLSALKAHAQDPATLLRRSYRDYNKELRWTGDLISQDFVHPHRDRLPKEARLHPATPSTAAACNCLTTETAHCFKIIFDKLGKAYEGQERSSEYEYRYPGMDQAMAHCGGKLPPLEERKIK